MAGSITVPWTERNLSRLAGEGWPAPWRLPKLDRTAITGIYGTNFQYMPEPRWRDGYVGTLRVAVSRS